MSSIKLESKQPAPFNGLPDPSFFYGNLSTLEVLAALRFGIEARKGLILFTGETGTGKSVLLQELRRDLNPQVTCLLLDDPQFSFSELLQLILRALKVRVESDDESELIPRCKTAIRSRLEQNGVVSLLFDDAHRLPDEIIGSLTKHFLGKGFDSDNNLLQIVLAGRPDLRTRLFMPPLRSLDTQVEIESRTQPLDAKDVGLYIEHRLAAADLPTETFDHEAIERIAVYSEGKPGSINAICDRTLQLTDRSPTRRITSDMVAAAARELFLWKTDFTSKDTPKINSRTPKPRNDVSGFPSTTIVADTFLNLNDAKDRNRRFSPPRRRTGMAILVLVVVLAGVSAAWLRRESLINYAEEWGINLGEFAGSNRQTPDQGQIEANAPPPAATQYPPSLPIPNDDVPAPQSDKSETSDLARAKIDESVEPPASVPVEQPPTNTLEPAPARPKQDRRESARKEAQQQGKDVANQVSRAIRNRAIFGVDVSVSEGVTYLDGRVATQQQKNAAELAARGVLEVRRIRNRITVE